MDRNEQPFQNDDRLDTTPSVVAIAAAASLAVAREDGPQFVYPLPEQDASERWA